MRVNFAFTTLFTSRWRLGAALPKYLDRDLRMKKISKSIFKNRIRRTCLNHFVSQVKSLVSSYK